MSDGTESTRISRILLIAGLFLLVAGAAVVGVAHYRQSGLIAEIEEVGGMVHTEPLGPDWLRDPGVNYLARGTDPVVWLKFGRPNATRREIDALLACIEQLPDLRTLRLPDVALTPADVERISRRTRVEAIDLKYSDITDEGLAAIARLPRLDWLVLDSTGVTDEGLRHLRAATRLEMVSLERTGITDAGLEHLAALPHLDRVYLGGSAVTDEGVARLVAARPGLRVNR